MNNLEEYADIFDGIQPWSGMVLPGYFVDFLGTLTEAAFRAPFQVAPESVGGHHVVTRLPSIEDGEGWFEAVNWVVAAREARERYTMITLGACYGAQAVGSQHALQHLNPMPYKLVAVEPEPENYKWIIRHMRTNGIDPDGQWLIQAALSNDNAPVLFPVGAPGTGAQNCVSTNESKSRKIYAEELIAAGRAEEVLSNLLIHNTTGLKHRLVPDHDWEAEIKVVSAVTLNDVLGPFDFVDYLEADIQQSEILVFPPAAAALRRKVRRIHIGTHGPDVHWSLHRMFEQQGWEIVFSYQPGSTYREAFGTFTTQDGVLTVRNPALKRSFRRGFSRLLPGWVRARVRRSGLSGLWWSMRTRTSSFWRSLREPPKPTRTILPLGNIPFPRIELDTCLNPIPPIVTSQEFLEADTYFAESPASRDALVSSGSQALLYALVRNLEPEHTVEIGTFYASTSEAICRALYANGRGMLHTIDPYYADDVARILAQWPDELRKHITYYPANSMAFFEQLARMRTKPDLIFIDGNHEYEFALFDVQSAARHLRRGGFIAMDNVSQSGPFFAALDFLTQHPDWIECGVTASKPDGRKAFDPDRSNIPGTDLILLRAPFTYRLDRRPFSPGEMAWKRNSVDGLRLPLLNRPPEGVLHVQLVLRGFSGQRQAEQVVHAERRITDADMGCIEVPARIAVSDDFDRYTVEPWLIWTGRESLSLPQPPSVF